MQGEGDIVKPFENKPEAIEGEAAKGPEVADIQKPTVMVDGDELLRLRAKAEIYDLMAGIEHAQRRIAQLNQTLK